MAYTGIGAVDDVYTANGSSIGPSFQPSSASGSVTTITGNSGPAETPLNGNFNIVGLGSITVAGSANTQNVQLTGLTNHAVLVGAGTTLMTKVGPSATSGAVFLGQGAAADPIFSLTTTVDGAGNVATQSSSAGGSLSYFVANTSGSNDSAAGFFAAVSVAGGTADPFMLYAIGPSGERWIHGIDQSDSSSWKLDNDSVIGNDTVFKVTVAGVPTFPKAPLGVPSGGSGATTLTGILNGNGTSPYTATPAKLLIQQLRNTTSTPTSTATVIPYDTSLPQNTEGAQVFSQAITPTNAANIIHVYGQLIGGGSISFLIAALFKDSAADAIAAWSCYAPTTTTETLAFHYYEVAASTSARTYAMRYGPEVGTGYLNQSSSAVTLGGIMTSAFIVEEIQV